jgi:hypothetical protein
LKQERSKIVIFLWKLLQVHPLLDNVLPRVCVNREVIEPSAEAFPRLNHTVIPLVAVVWLYRKRKGQNYQRGGQVWQPSGGTAGRKENEIVAVGNGLA